MADLEIFALVLGHSPDSIFSVIARDDTSVSTWRERVHAKVPSTLEKCKPSDLTIWKLKQPLTIPDEDAPIVVGQPGQPLSEIASKMQPTKELSQYFPLTPTKGVVHVIVVPNLPSAGEKHGRLSEDDADGERAFKRHRTEREEAFKIAQKKPKPSNAATSNGLLQAQRKDPFLNGRPFDAVGPPITIYEQIFSTFCAMNEGKVPFSPLPDDYEHAKEFLVASSKIYSAEAERQTAIDEPLAKLLRRPLVAVTLRDGTSNDGLIQEHFEEKACLILIRELKNEVGSGGDPSVQVGYSYTRWWASPLGSHFRDRTCCPSFLLAIAGPWICVQGGILAGKHWTVQPLTDFVWVGPTTDMEGQVQKTTRLLCSLKVALDGLTERFRAVKDTPLPSPPPFFPSITSYLDEITTVSETLNYNDRLHFEEDGRGATAIFSATLGSGQEVFVKFVTRYNAPAHRLLAKAGLAPRLRHCSELADGGTHFMVVMDLIDGDNMHAQIFQMEDLTRIRTAKNLLHENDYVFGDLRPNNIFMPKNGAGVILVDFDWCGKAGVDRYPVEINNDPSCNWHSDVRAGELMQKLHDDHLFDSFGR